MNESEEKGAVNSSFRTVSLVQMRPGQNGKIVEINGGAGLTGRLEALGIRTGKQIEKISGQLMRGPVLFRHNHTQAAIGFGMACKVMVEVTAGD